MLKKRYNCWSDRGLLLPGSLLLAGLAAGGLPAAPVDFSHDIVPILRQNCAACHTGDKQKGGLSMNTRESLLAGSENGAVVAPGRSAQSKLVQLLLSKDPDNQMPPEGDRVPPAQIALIQRWIDEGLPWTAGFAFKAPAYEPPLRPRRVELPPARDGRNHPVDRIMDAYLAERNAPRPQPISDGVFARRVHLDLIGLLPEPKALETFKKDSSPNKRARLVRELLGNDTAYAEHWLTFWNDLLRNDYAGTGYIDGGRKQITAWLYRSLVDNKPYDRMARELIAPDAESEGFARGIKWRGEVSAGQSVPVQFAQSVGQAFLGINLKCASCHDSFVDRWKLEESYGLAAVYAETPLEIYRCDKPVGKTARPGWLFPELGQVATNQPPAERLKQLAALMTHPENGRFSRTIVNRLWHRLMGRGIVHPVDAMQTEPWNADLLDYLATDFADQRYDLKKALELICTSEAYQSKTQVVARDTDDHGYTYAGPRARRLSAEQFVDVVWQITGTAPARWDAPVLRGKADPAQLASLQFRGQWLWSSDGSTPASAGETLTLRTEFVLPEAPARAGAAITCDNSYTLYVNGRKVRADDDWETVEAIPLDSHLHQGTNEILIVTKNGGVAPNPAGLFFEARVRLAGGSELTVASDSTWDYTRSLPDGEGRFQRPPTNWQPAVVVTQPGVWTNRLGTALASALIQAALTPPAMTRASLMTSDLLMRALGRPNREQIVSMRPNDLTTLEAIDLSNGHILASRLDQGSNRLLAQPWKSGDDLARWLYTYALARAPSGPELATAREALGSKPSATSVQDLLWSVFMLPEFQLVR